MSLLRLATSGALLLATGVYGCRFIAWFLDECEQSDAAYKRALMQYHADVARHAAIRYLDMPGWRPTSE